MQYLALQEDREIGGLLSFLILPRVLVTYVNVHVQERSLIEKQKAQI